MPYTNVGFGASGTRRHYKVRTFHSHQLAGSGSGPQIPVTERLGRQQRETNGTDEHSDRHAYRVARRSVAHVSPAKPATIRGQRERPVPPLRWYAFGPRTLTVCFTSLFEHCQRPTVDDDVLRCRQTVNGEHDADYHVQVRPLGRRLGQPDVDVAGQVQ